MSEMIEMDEVMGDSNVPTEGTGTMPQVYDGVFMLPLTAIVHDPFFDCRVALDEEVIERYTGRYRGYKEAIERDEERDYPFPPICVWYHERQYVRITGSLRIASAHNAGIDYIEAEVFLGTKAEALKIALVDNAANGALLTRGDLRLCITKALVQFRNDYTPGVIAEMLGCSPSYVAEIDDELSASGDVPTAEKRKGKDGKMYPVPQKGAEKRQNRAKPPKIDGSEQPGEGGSEEPQVPMKSELEQVQEALAEFDRLEQTMSCPDILYAEVGSWLDKRKHIEQPKTIASKMDSVNAEQIMPFWTPG